MTFEGRRYDDIPSEMSRYNSNIRLGTKGKQSTRYNLFDLIDNVVETIKRTSASFPAFIPLSLCLSERTYCDRLCLSLVSLSPCVIVLAVLSV